MAVKKKDAGGEGAPRWTYVVGAIVAIGGLVWGITSFFLSGSPPHARAPATSPPPPSLTVSGSGSVGVGNMSGGSISVGDTQKNDKPAEPGDASK